MVACTSIMYALVGRIACRIKATIAKHFSVLGFPIGSDSSQSGQLSSGSPNLGVITSSSDNESGEEEDDEGDLVTENSEFISCLHQGKIYRDGDVFTANVSGLPISMADQCMQCICQVIYMCRHSLLIQYSPLRFQCSLL